MTPEDNPEIPGPSVEEALRSVGPLLPLFARQLRMRDDPGFLEAHHLSPRHGTVLALLVHAELGVGALSQQMRLALPTVSGLLADLDHAGIVERRADPADRRRTLVRLVPARRAEAEAWLMSNVAPIIRVLEQLTPAERAAWVRAMNLAVAETAPGTNP